MPIMFKIKALALIACAFLILLVDPWQKTFRQVLETKAMTTNLQEFLVSEHKQEKEQEK